MSSGVGERIRRLRLANNLGQIDFAKQLGIASGTVSMIENGRLAVTADLIAAVAGVVNCSPEFLGRDEVIYSVTRPWLRAYADAPKRQLDQQLSDAVTAIEAVECLPLQRIPDVLPTFVGDLTDDSAIEQFAGDVRAAAQIDDGEVVRNSIRAAERLGCVVLPMGEELGRHLGISTRVNLTPVICASRPSEDPDRHVPGDRQRHTVAHELGHLALHGSQKPPESAADAAVLEKQAHLFASAFLAPADAMLEELGDLGGRVTLQTLARIKERWGVSIKSLVNRFRTMGIIDSDQARSLYKQISSRGWNKAEPMHVGNETAVWLSKSISKWNQANDGAFTSAARASGLGAMYFERWTDWTPTPGPTDGEVINVDFLKIKAGSGQRKQGTVTILGRSSKRRSDLGMIESSPTDAADD